MLLYKIFQIQRWFDLNVIFPFIKLFCSSNQIFYYQTYLITCFHIMLTRIRWNNRLTICGKDILEFVNGCYGDVAYNRKVDKRLILESLEHTYLANEIELRQSRMRNLINGE